MKNLITDMKTSLERINNYLIIQNAIFNSDYITLKTAPSMVKPAAYRNR